MEKYYKRKEPSSDHIDKISIKSMTDNIPRVPPPIFTPTMPKLVDLDNLPWDPAERIRILEYHPNQRDEIRQKYWLRGPCQPRGHTYPIRMIGNQKRHFSDDWFDKHGDWLEYSMKVDKVFCLCCYLCSDYMGNKGGSDSFAIKGFNCWNKSERLITHVGELNSYHNRALQCCEDLVKQGQSIDVAFQKQDDIVREANKIRLKATTDLARVMVETNKHVSFYLVYRLLKLALVLPVATATVERCFSAMKLVKSDLRNRIGDDFLDACLVCAVEKEALASVTSENVMCRFGKKRRRSDCRM